MQTSTPEEITTELKAKERQGKDGSIRHGLWQAGSNSQAVKGAIVANAQGETNSLGDIESGMR